MFALLHVQEEGKQPQKSKIQNAPLSALKTLQTSPGLSLKDFNPQPGNTYKKKAQTSLIHKELMRKTG